MNAENENKAVAALAGRPRDIAERLPAYCEKAANPVDLLPVMDELNEMFDWRADKKVEDVFKPEDDAYQAVAALIGRQATAIARTMWERAARYPRDVTPGWTGASVPGLTLAMNTARGECLDSRYIVNNIIVLLNYIAALKNGFSIRDYLDERTRVIRELGVADPLSAFGGMYGSPDDAFYAFRKRVEEAEKALPAWPGLEYFLPPLLGQMIDNDDVEARNFVFTVQKILAGEGGRGSIFAPLLSGYLLGIRAAVPTLDPFPLWLLAYPSQVINDYDNPVKTNFLRVMHCAPPDLFALLCNAAFTTSIPGPEHLEQAFLWWTGIEFDTSAYGVGRRDDILHAALRCLSSAGYRADSLRGSDALRIYLSLWALACDNAGLAIAAAAPLLKSGPIEQVIPALCFVEKLESDAASAMAAETLAKRAELAENAWVREFLNCDAATRKTLRLTVYPAMGKEVKAHQLPITYEEELPPDSYPAERDLARPYLNAHWRQ